MGAAHALVAELKAAPAGSDFVSRHFSIIVLAIAVAATYSIVFGAQSLFGRDVFARSVARDEVRAPLACFGLDGAEPYHPGTLAFTPPPLPARMADWRHADPLRRLLYAKWAREQELRELFSQCSRVACAGEREQVLNRALLDYVKDRKRVTRALDELHGAAGLRHILRDYDTPFDRQVVQLIRTQQAAGRLDLPAKSALAAELKLLTERGSAAFVPCRGPGFQLASDAARPVRNSIDWATRTASDFWK